MWLNRLQVHSKGLRTNKFFRVLPMKTDFNERESSKDLDVLLRTTEQREHNSRRLRTHHYTVVIGDHMYLWGGQGMDLHSGTVEILNVRSLKWQQKSTTGNVPNGVLRYACTAVNESIYYFGGNCEPAECFHNSICELNTEALHWREIKPDSDSNNDGPIKKHGSGMVHSVINGQDHLLVFGGAGKLNKTAGRVSLKYANVTSQSSGFVYTNEIHLLSLKESEHNWTIPTVVGSLPPPCAYFTLDCICQNTYILFGGIHTDLGLTNTIYLLTVVDTNVHIEKILRPFEAKVDWPRRRISHSATPVNVLSSSGEYTHHLLVLGGLDNDFSTISDCWILNNAVMTWSKVVLPECITLRFDHSVSAFFISGQCTWIVIVGGLTELDSTRKLNAAVEFVAMFELVHSEGKWTIGNVTVDINELKHIQSQRRERMLIDRLLEGRRTFQQSVLRTKEVKNNHLMAETMKLAPAEKYQINCLPHWVIDINEINLSKKVVGGGSYGEVTIAMFRGMQVAAKGMHDIIISDYNVEMFTREMDILSKLRHPNIIQFLGATLIDNPILLFELMSASLSSILHCGPLSKLQITSISTQISYALAYLHLHKPTPIIHRDVSSVNILLEQSCNDSWKAKLSDFGSANLLCHTKTSVPGNLAYSAPEAEFAVNHTPAMDVYSMGVVIMEISLHKIPCRLVFERFEQSRLIGWIPLKQIVTDCIAYEYGERPTATKLITLLQQL